MDEGAKTEKKGIIQEFKDFAFRGNVLDLAVAVIIGAAFNAIVQSFVTDLITPFIGAIFSTDDLKEISVTLNGSEVTYGAFLAAVVNFFLVAIAIFILVKGINKLRETQLREDEVKAKEQEEKAKAEEEAAKSEVKLLTEIRDLLQSGK
jgi:large conductance mechanosensitive channel